MALTDTPARVPPPADLRQLTSLRALAAAWVVAFHYWGDLFGSSPPPGLVAKGYLGVEVFFVLSGFILSHVYLDGFGIARSRSWSRYGGFLWARVARIYPAHLFTLAVIGAMALFAERLGAGGGGVIDWRALPANLALVQAWGLAPSAAWNHPSWSISAEWAAYLAFPLFARAAWRLRARPQVAMAGALVALVGAYALFPRLAGFPLTRATIDWGALRIVPPFAYGCALNLVWRATDAGGARRAGLLAAAFAALTLACAAVGAPDAATVAAAGGLILALAGLARAGSSVLASRGLVYLGEASFALYMVAIPWRAALAGAARRFTPLPEGGAWPPLLSLVLVAGVVVCAVATHQLVERPARLRLREIGLRRRFRPIEEDGACGAAPATNDHAGRAGYGLFTLRRRG